MKRGRDGSIRPSAADETRVRALAALQSMICPLLYHTIESQSTDNLLALIAKVRSEAPAESPAGGNE